MTRYLLRRIGQAAIVLVLVTIVVFVLIHLLPGGPARAILGTMATPTTVKAFNQANGLNHPIPVQYWDWITGVLKGNLGYSYQQNQSVASLLAQRIPKTAFLAGISVLIALLIAVPVGLYQAVRRSKIDDYALTVASFGLYSTPAFWLAIVLIDIFAVRMHVVPAEAAAQAAERLGTGCLAGFVHVPLLPAQVTKPASEPSMSFALQQAGLDVVLGTCRASGRTGGPVSTGRTG